MKKRPQKLPNHLKSSPNLNSCSIKISHRRTSKESFQIRWRCLLQLTPFPSTKTGVSAIWLDKKLFKGLLYNDFDNRLTFNSTTQLEELAMNWAFLDRIWRPDTFIVNGKDSYLHKMTVPNRFIRISPKGQIAYSQRLTLKAR